MKLSTLILTLIASFTILLITKTIFSFAGLNDYLTGVIGGALSTNVVWLISKEK